MDKLQNLPKETKKIILWLSLIIVGSALLFWWSNNLKLGLNNLKGEELRGQFQLPEIEMPKIETPNIPNLDGEE
ncbi:MAG: hypothetical protein ABIG08_01680 [bacterium]